MRDQKHIQHLVFATFFEEDMWLLLVEQEVLGLVVVEQSVWHHCKVRA